jgi:hypothetical protein
MLFLDLIEILILLMQPLLTICIILKIITILNACCFILLTIILMVFITYIKIKKYGEKDDYYKSLMNIIIIVSIQLSYICFFNYFYIFISFIV